MNIKGRKGNRMKGKEGILNFKNDHDSKIHVDNFRLKIESKYVNPAIEK